MHLLNKHIMKYIFFIGLVLLVFTVFSKEYSRKEKASIELNSIEYKTLASKDGFDIRQYPELIVAKTVLSSNSYSNNSSSGFRKIASYIFGGNNENQQIAMTSPVQMDMGPNPSMSFFMPTNKSLANLPKPNRKDVFIIVQPSKVVAVLKFSGWASDKVLKEQFNILKTQLNKEGIEFENSFSFLGYNPPYQLLNRKNEVIIPLLNYQY